MDRKDFLVSTFGPVREILASLGALVKRIPVPLVLLALGLFLYLADFGINWGAVIDLFTSVISAYWMYIVPGIGIIIALRMIRRRLSPEALVRFNKIFSIILNTAAILVLIWIVYDYFTKGQYGKIIFMVVVYAILRLFNSNDKIKESA